MKRWTAALGLTAVVGGLIASGLWIRSTGDPFAALVARRMKVLRPLVERELGAAVPGPIRVVLSTREEIGRSNGERYRKLLQSIEGAPPVEAEQGGWDGSGILGCVDDDGTIHICREELEGIPRDDFLGEFLDRLAAPSAPDPGALDAVLAHELVHVLQVRSLDLWGFLRSARNRSDLLARAAVSEGHATFVAMRAVPGSESFPGGEDPFGSEALYELALSNGHFDAREDGSHEVFKYGTGRELVESAVSRLGRDEAVRRLFSAPPSLLQVEHPESWPGTPAPSMGTDEMLLPLRKWLDMECKATDCGPLPTGTYLDLLKTASAPARDAAAAALLEVQRIKGEKGYYRNAIRGHLLAAVDEAGARALHDAWVEAAKGRDDRVPRDRKWRHLGVLDSSWSTASVDGSPVTVAERRYMRMGPLMEHAVVVRRGRYVLELRLIEDPGGAPAALRLARRVLAFVVDSPDRADAGSPSWEDRFRFAANPAVAVAALEPLLEDPDPDVRHAALGNLQRRGALSDGDRTRGRSDPDPLVRLTALVGGLPGEDPAVEDLLIAVRDPGPWVAAGGWCAAADHFLGGRIPGGEVAAALDRPESVVRRAASRILGGLDNEEDADVLALVRLALADGDPGVRHHATDPLLHMASETPGLGAVFTGLLSDPDVFLRNDALITLSIRNGVPGTVPALLPFLRSEEDVDLALGALGRAGEDALPAVPEIRRIGEEAGRAGNTARRLAANVAVARITGDRSESIAVLRDLLASGSEEEARTAVGVSEEFKATEELLPEMVGRLATGDRPLVLRILTAIEEAGAGAEAALPALHSLGWSDDPSIRRAARETGDAIRKSMRKRSRR